MENKITSFNELITALEKLHGYKIGTTRVTDYLEHSDCFAGLQVSYFGNDYQVKTEDAGARDYFATSEDPQLIYDVIEKIYICD